MPPRIANGLCFQAPFERAVLLLGTKYTSIQNLVDEVQTAMVVRRFVAFVDDNATAGAGAHSLQEPPAEAAYHTVWELVLDHLQKEQATARASFDPDPSIHTDVEVQLCAAFDDRVLLGQVKQGATPAYELLLNTPGVLSFPWHKGSPPRGLSEEVWALRAQSWAKALDPETGFSFQQYWVARPVEPSKVLARLPTTDERVARRALATVVETEALRLQREGRRTPIGRLRLEVGAAVAEGDLRLNSALSEEQRSLARVLPPTEAFERLLFEPDAMPSPSGQGRAPE